MKILMHCVYFPPEVGGLESHVFYLCRALAARGHTVDVVTSLSQPGLPKREVMEGITVWRSWLPGRNPLGWLTHAAASTPRLGELALQADIIHAQAFQSVLPGVVAARAAKTPLVSTWHTSHFLQRAENPFWAPILRRLLEWSDQNLAASREIADVAERLAPGVRVEAVTNGVETELFKRSAPTLGATEKKRIIVPRRLFKKNGVEFFIRALPQICDAIDVEAVIVGDGPERPRLEALVAEVGVGDCVSFLGERANAEMPGVLSSGDLAVFPSLMEATSVAALEAMACELPVVASNVGGLPEIVDDTVGGLFEPADPQSLAARVITTLERRDLPELGRVARGRVVASWSNRRLVDRHLEIYTKLLNQSGSTAGS